MPPTTRTQSKILRATATSALSLPLELRTKIILELLASDTPLRLYLKSILGVCKPILNNSLLAAQFSTLCLVSKQMREEAQKIFFQSNQWHLEIHLVRTYPEYERLRSEDESMMMYIAWERRGPAATSTRLNTAELICEHWGEKALLRMRDVRVDVRGQAEDAHADTKVAFKGLVHKLKRGSVRKLVVNWHNFYGMLGGKCGTGKRKMGEEIRLAMRQEDGSREEPRHKRIAGWGTKERILEPLLELRGLDEVRIMGCVTNQWAEHLEKSMRSKDEALLQPQRLARGPA